MTGPVSSTSRRAPAALGLAVGGLLLSLIAAPGALASSAAGARLQTVVVYPVVPNSATAAASAAAVTAAGGQVIDSLPMIGAVSARLPIGASLPTGFALTPDRPMHVASTDDGGWSGSSSSAATATTGPVSTVRQTVGLASVYRGGGNEGNGVTVAIVDTGIAEVPDLAGQIVAHFDVTGEGGGDGYGHGTFMAGLIAGNGAGSGGAYTGVAPGANLVDVKVATADGSTSLLNVLRGLQIVARRGPALGISVLNLSLSSGSPLPYQLDPLTLALDALWRHGVTVVVPAGNAGPNAGTITSPGNDPTLITAGAIDEGGTGYRGDDTIASYSSRGPAAQGVAKPDLAAPGAHLVSLRDPGSTIDAANPSARVGDSYFLGSGTSMSTAVTSGAVADVLAVNPNLSPDGVKALLTNTTYDAPGLSDASAAGTGGLSIGAAMRSAPDAENPDRTGSGMPALSASDSSALIALARAWSDDDRNAGLTAWSQLSAAARAWAARAWASLSPDARAWAAQTWSARAWADQTTSTEQWLARAWAARSWAARAWAAAPWAGRAWADTNWDGRAWAGRAWADDDFSARAWVARAWSARAWSVDSWS